MDRHAPYQLHRDKSDSCLLFIHGFAGSPYLFKPYIEMATSRGLDYEGILLPGHGGSARLFFETNRNDWDKAVHDKIISLRKRYKYLYVMAHSMGCLLTLHAHVEVPLEGLIFWAPAVMVHSNYRQWGKTTQLLFQPKEKKSIEQIQLEELMGVEPPRLYEYIPWTGQFVEFFRIMVKAPSWIEQVRCPIQIILSKADETVSFRSRAILRRHIKNVEPDWVILQKSSHNVFEASESIYVRQRVEAFLDSLLANRT